MYTDLVERVVRAHAGAVLLDTAHQPAAQLDVTEIHSDIQIACWLRPDDAPPGTRLDLDLAKRVAVAINLRARQLAEHPAVRDLREAVCRRVESEVSAEAKNEVKNQAAASSTSGIEHELLPLHDADDGDPPSAAERFVKAFWAANGPEPRGTERDSGVVEPHRDPRLYRATLTNAALGAAVSALSGRTAAEISARLEQTKSKPPISDHMRVRMDEVFCEYRDQRPHLEGRVVRFHARGQTVGLVVLTHDPAVRCAGHSLVLMQHICCSVAFRVARCLFPECGLGSLNDAALRAATEYARFVGAQRVYVQPIGRQEQLLPTRGLARQPKWRFPAVSVRGQSIPPTGMFFGPILYTTSAITPTAALPARVSAAVADEVRAHLAPCVARSFDWTRVDVPTLVHNCPTPVSTT